LQPHVLNNDAIIVGKRATALHEVGLDRTKVTQTSGRPLCLNIAHMHNSIRSSLRLFLRLFLLLGFLVLLGLLGLLLVLLLLILGLAAVRQST
jgi:hypothetical protein